MQKASSDTTATRCRTCNDALEERDTCYVVVGLQDRGLRRTPRHIVRPYCPTCVEAYYHVTIYSDG